MPLGKIKKGGCWQLKAIKKHDLHSARATARVNNKSENNKHAKKERKKERQRQKTTTTR